MRWLTHKIPLDKEDKFVKSVLIYVIMTSVFIKPTVVQRYLFVARLIVLVNNGANINPQHGESITITTFNIGDHE